MKNKNGFTLVELLAVIAILAILVIIALPNVLKMFNEAKKKVFLSEVQTIYKEAAKKYITESMKGNNIDFITSSDETRLDISGEKMDYCIALDSKGNVMGMIASNGIYYVLLIGSRVEEISMNDIKKGEVNAGTCSVVEHYEGSNPCTYDGDLVPGATYVNGQYTYKFMQQGALIYEGYGLDWEDINTEYVDPDAYGWGVQLTNKYTTEPVTTKLCSSINGKPIISMAAMFSASKAESIDLSSFDTSHVYDMSYMFAGSLTPMLDLKTLNTSNVVNMERMFYSNAATSLDLSGFDTRNVYNMWGMFEYSEATRIDFSSFNTSNVENMGYMFIGSKIENLDLSNFDTSNVYAMNSMFEYAESKTINLSSFNTSNVGYMNYMFSESQATTLDLSGFNTSNVTDMYQMFYGSQATTLDLSSFNTSNVTNMQGMFTNSNIKTIYVGDGWSTDSLILTGWGRTSDLFRNATNLVGGAGTVYNESNPVDITYARVDDPENGKPGYFTYKASN